jgi:transposase
VESSEWQYSQSAMERTMKVQEVILRAMAGKLKWWEAAEILGVTDRTMRRWRQNYEEFGYDGLFHRQRGKPSPKRIPVETIEKVLGLYQEQYFDFNVRHFHEKLGEQHGIELSYTLVKNALQGAGLVSKQKRRSVHRRRRPRRPLPGMLLHMDGSTHAWFKDERWYDLIVILDDATSEIYYAQLVEEEGTRTVMVGLREVIEKRGVFCALYSDRGTHFFVNPKAGEPVDKARLTQVGRALRELGIQMIPAYSPQARGRMERSYRTWQGRLPQELRIRGLQTKEAANTFLRTEYMDEFNRRFAVAAEGKGSAFVKTRRRDLDLIFSIQHQRTVNQDNTVMVDNRVFQIEKTRWRNTLAGCSVVVHEHLDGSITIQFGPHEIARFTAGQLPPRKPAPSHGARPLGHARAKKLNGLREAPAIPSRPVISHRIHPSSLPSGALRAGWTEPGCAAKEIQLTRGNGRR